MILGNYYWIQFPIYVDINLCYLFIFIFYKMIIILILEYSPEKEKIDLEKILNDKGFASNNLKLILLINILIN